MFLLSFQPKLQLRSWEISRRPSVMLSREHLSPPCANSYSSNASPTGGLGPVVINSPAIWHPKNTARGTLSSIPNWVLIQNSPHWGQKQKCWLLKPPLLFQAPICCHLVHHWQCQEVPWMCVEWWWIPLHNLYQNLFPASRNCNFFTIIQWKISIY